VFEPFFTTRRAEGFIGLGLHTVYNLVSGRLRGQIEVTSAPGKGTCFTMRFPKDAPTA
jgi:signal transduction histidine kinase